MEGIEMTGAAVTFDFHNTLAQCDEWFDVEVCGLVSAFLRWQADTYDTFLDPSTLRSADLAYRQLRLAIQEHGNELTAEECVATVLDELGLSYRESELARGVEHLMRPHIQEAQPMPGAVETVRELANAGVTLGVISNAVYHPFLLWSLDLFGIADAFHSITSSASAGFYKSRTELYEAAMAALDASPERSVHVGDSERFDIVAARKAGMRTVYVRDPFESVKADLTLPNLVNSAPLILGLLRSDAGQTSQRSSAALR